MRNSRIKAFITGIVIVLLQIVAVNIAVGQTGNDVLDLKDPITGKWGYASKVQNRKSSLRGLKKIAVSTLGKTGSSVMTKSDAREIDWTVPPQYDAVASNFSEDLACVEIGGLVGFIDIRNRFIIEPQYEPMKDMEGFKFGLAVVKIGSKYGYIDKEGHVVIEPVYEYAENFTKDMLATVKQDGKFGAIDLKGNMVVPATYKMETAMKTVPVSNKEYRKAVDDISERINAGEYKSLMDNINEVSDRVQKRVSDSSWVQPLKTSVAGTGRFQGIKDQYKRVIIPCEFSSISYDDKHHLYIVTDSINRYGLYSYKGDRFFHPLFDKMERFGNGKSNVEVAGLTGWVDAEGNLSPSFMDEICDAGLKYDTEGHIGQAVSLYERILTIDPNHVMALNNLAIIDINNKDYNKGLKKLKLAHKLAPDNELISENLHAAKKNRNERRWNRITTGLEIAAAVITIGAATYSAVNVVSAPTSGLSPSGSMATGDYSSGSSSSKRNDNTSSSKANHANWRALDNAYSGYEDQLIRMKSSGNYDKQEVKNIQRKMRDIRDKIYKQSGGHQRAVSSMESWNP